MMTRTTAGRGLHRALNHCGLVEGICYSHKVLKEGNGKSEKTAQDLETMKSSTSSLHHQVFE